MKIELKNVSFNERMSEETNCYVANLYINGKRVGYVKNDGQGGQTDYHGNSMEDSVIIRQAELYCQKLPKIKSEQYNFEYQPSLESVIDDLFENWLKAKETKKMEKTMKTAILYGVPNGLSYTRISWSKNTPLSAIPVNILQNTVDKIKKEKCVNGVEILNTNLQALGVNI